MEEKKKTVKVCLLLTFGLHFTQMQTVKLGAASRKKPLEDFPGDLVVKDLALSLLGYRFNQWLDLELPHAVDVVRHAWTHVPTHTHTHTHTHTKEGRKAGRKEKSVQCQTIFFKFLLLILRFLLPMPIQEGIPLDYLF